MIKLSWPVTLIVLAILGGSTFLGYEHTVNADAVLSIYSTIIGGVLVGHFVQVNNAQNGSNGSNGKAPPQ